jgi:hypothetical protein
MSQIIPIPRIPVSVRPGAPDDLPFIDALQKKHAKQVGWFPTKTIEGKIKAGHVLLAVDDAGGRVGYLIGSDRYFKHDDVGVIYQINVDGARRRALVGATLLKAQFERSAYGCRLYCCWCAQDIEANRFWEAMGFVPLAFRAGSRGKGRVHIFWQRRTRAGDTTTPYWFPAQTSGGSLREDRLVFPIPAGVRWSDEMPRVLPAPGRIEGPEGGSPAERPKGLPGTPAKRQTVEQPPALVGGLSRSKLHFAVPAAAATAPKEKAPREKRKAVKNDPRLVAAARELRDRWLERMNAAPPPAIARGKYDVCRAFDASVRDDERLTVTAKPVPLLGAA